jgi:hypothetical protein
MERKRNGLQDAQKRLRLSLFDRRIKGEDVQLRSACAEMLLDLGEQQRCWTTFVDHLLSYADCDRVDAGPCRPDDVYISRSGEIVDPSKVLTAHCLV